MADKWREDASIHHLLQQERVVYTQNPAYLEIVGAMREAQQSMQRNATYTPRAGLLGLGVGDEVSFDEQLQKYAL